MNDETLLEMVRKADPLPATAVVGDHSAALLERVLASARAEPAPGPAVLRRPGLVVLGVALALGSAAAGLAIAAGGWLSGEPAPPAVVTDFQAYTPQLGFHPDPSSAVLVAKDGPIRLYATTNREGTYCLVLESPWRSARTLDGGTCVPEPIASGQFIAGLIGAATQSERRSTLVVGGRIADTSARAVRFTGPNGDRILRRVGTSGFFVAAVSTQWPCANGNWTSTFKALDGQGHQVAQLTIPLTQTTSRPGARIGGCLLSFLRS